VYSLFKKMSHKRFVFHVVRIEVGTATGHRYLVSIFYFTRSVTGSVILAVSLCNTSTLMRLCNYDDKLLCVQIRTCTCM